MLKSMTGPDSESTLQPSFANSSVMIVDDSSLLNAVLSSFTWLAACCVNPQCLTTLLLLTQGADAMDADSGGRMVDLTPCSYLAMWSHVVFALLAGGRDRGSNLDMMTSDPLSRTAVGERNSAQRCSYESSYGRGLRQTVAETN